MSILPLSIHHRLGLGLPTLPVLGIAAWHHESFGLRDQFFLQIRCICTSTTGGYGSGHFGSIHFSRDYTGETTAKSFITARVWLSIQGYSRHFNIIRAAHSRTRYADPQTPYHEAGHASASNSQPRTAFTHFTRIRRALEGSSVLASVLSPRLTAF
jgi:hypothetical protein